MTNNKKRCIFIAYHYKLSGHEIGFDNIRILAEETSSWPKLINEGLEINKLQPTVRLTCKHNTR